MLDLGDGWIWSAGALLPLFFLPRRKALSRFTRIKKKINSLAISQRGRKKSDGKPPHSKVKPG
jgi:hypothetical protein